MRLCRYDDNRLGVVQGDGIADVTAALEHLPSLRWPLPPGDLLVAEFDRLRPLIERLAKAQRAAVPLASVRLLSPVANPGKIIGAPVNYRKHQAESQADAGINFGTEVKTIDHYGLFLKASGSLVGPGEGIEVAFPARRHDHEGELALVIGRGGRNIPRSRAMRHILGYCIGLDMTVRGTEDRSLRKSLDTYAVLGPWLVTADEIGDPGALDLRLAVNGEPRQAANTRDLIFDVPRLIEYASSYYTLHPGDIIMTGTPEGVGPVKPGDTITAEIAGIGRMEVKVRLAGGTAG